MDNRQIALLSTALLLTACDPLPPDETHSQLRESALNSDETDAPTTNEVVWSHPMMTGVGVSPTPLFEAKNDPAGRRYAYGGEISVKEDGTYVNREVLLRLERTAIPETTPTQQPAPHAEVPASKIGAGLAAQLEGLDGLDIVRVEVVTKSDFPGFQYDLERMVAEGLIESQDEWDTQRDILIEDRLSEVADLNSPLIDLVTASGGEVVSVCQTRPCVAADIPAAAIDTLAASPLTTRILTLDISGSPTSADGTDVRHGHQVQQLLQQTYDGEGATIASTDDIVVAIVESVSTQGSSVDERYDSNHPAFKDDAGTTLRRAVTGASNGWRWWCDTTQSPTCNHNTFPSSMPEGNHQTQVAGLIMGDFEDGQVSGLTAAEEAAASGYAPEARGHFFLAANSTAFREAMDELPGITSGDDPPHIANMSVRYNTDCSGADAHSIAANNAFLDGIAVIAAAGNEGGSASNCTVGAPGTALGSFTVGAIGHSSSAVNSPADIRTASIWSETGGGFVSGWGGNSTEGQGRTIVDMVAIGRRNSKLDPGETIDSGISGLNATSHATATVSGAAASLMDSAIANGKTWIDHPGRLYAFLLTMGDRQTTSGKTNAGFDPHWGAGRLRVRMARDGGLDAPFQFHRFSTCIDDGEIYTFDISNLSGDMETVKAAAYWYDKRHDGSFSSSSVGTVANIDMTLLTSTYSILRTDFDADDNKAFIHHYTTSMPTGLKLRLHGTDVEGHDFGCGNDSIMVHVVVFVEDSDRESPTYNAISGEGIAPENL